MDERQLNIFATNIVVGYSKSRNAEKRQAELLFVKVFASAILDAMSEAEKDKNVISEAVELLGNIYKGNLRFAYAELPAGVIEHGNHLANFNDKLRAVIAILGLLLIEFEKRTF